MTITSFRFTLPLLLASSAATLLACGDDPAKQFADAPRADAATDAATPDAATNGVVEVTIVDSAGPVAGATVLFQNADDSVVATKTTDAAGLASQVMNVGGSITAIVVEQNIAPAVRGGVTTQTYTVLAVKPGDKLKIRANRQGTISIVDPVSVKLPPNSFGTYEIRSSCGTRVTGLTTDKGGALNITVPPTCTQASFLVKQEATSGSGGAPAAAIYKANVALANGSFDLSDQTFAGLVVHNISGSNMPEIVNVQTGVASLLGGFLGEISESDAVIMPPGFPTFAGTFQRPNVAATKQLVTMQVRSNVGQQQLAALTNVGDVTVDGATALTPWVSDVQYTQANSSFQITTAAAGNAPVNGAFARLGLGRQTGFVNRQVVGPSATSLRLPILPTAQADLNVLVTDSAFVNDAGIISSPGGYDALRPLFYSINGPQEFFGPTPTVNGQLCVSLYVNNR
jgi:hypothetical protein